MAANTCTCSVGTVSGTDPSFILTYNNKQSQGVVFYIKYTHASDVNVTITFDVKNPSLHATDKYRYAALDGSRLIAYRMELDTSGNYRIPLPIIEGEDTIYANITFGAAGGSAAVVANFIES